MNHLLSYFYEISAIPRASYHEEKIATYLTRFASSHHLETVRDAWNNVLIRKPASAGYESAPTVLLQGHTDMVCEKNAGVVHNFDTDGIRILRKDDILYADGTTLGADNGYAVAAMLAILSDNTLEHPALECLFTTSEEVGLDGMRNFDASQLHSHIMINLDSCEEDCATAACAGGVRTHLHRTCSTVPVSGTALCLHIGGLMGGHSGEDIHRGRANALKIAARMYTAVCRTTDNCLISVQGGNKDNAIPRECTVRWISRDPEAEREALSAYADVIRNELSTEDRAFSVCITEEAFSGYGIASDDADALFALLRILPCGPLAMSNRLPGVVETSCNTAVVSALADGMDVTVSSRSSVESKLDDLCELLETCGHLTGFTAEHRNRYPGWDFSVDSQIQTVYTQAAEECLHKAPRIIGIHAGLECGLMREKRPDMDMISIGPNIWDLHTPQERMSISSAERVYEMILTMLKKIR